MSKAIALVSIAALNLKAGTQFRESLDSEAVKDYAQKLTEWKESNLNGPDGKPLDKAPAMSAWTKCPLPAITVFETKEDGTINADGFHRVKAAEKAGLTEYPAEVHQGTKDDAISFALKANATHGVRLTDADKQKKLKAALKIAAFKEMSNNALAKSIGVSEFFVRAHRPATSAPTVRTAVSKTGKTSKVDTSRIGKKGGKKAKPAKKKGKDAPATGKTDEEKALAGIGDGATVKAFDADTEAAIKKIVASVNETKVADGAALEASIRNGSVEISTRDLKTLAQAKPDRLALVYPLVFGEKRMTPTQAFALVEKVPDSNMKLGHLFNLATARKGILVERAENVASDPSSGFHIIIIPAKDHTVLRNRELGSIFAVSTANKDKALAAIKEA